MDLATIFQSLHGTNIGVLLIGSLCVGTLCALWVFRGTLLAPYRSPLLALPGPPSSTASWMLGHLREVFESDTEMQCDGWTEQYGTTYAYREFLKVGRARSGARYTESLMMDPWALGAIYRSRACSLTTCVR